MAIHLEWLYVFGTVQHECTGTNLMHLYACFCTCYKPQFSHLQVQYFSFTNYSSLYRRKHQCEFNLTDISA